MATVSKNIFWSSITSALQLYTGSIVFIVLAKLMSVQDFGILSFGFSLSALAVIVSDFGFSLMVIKDYPQREGGHGKYLSNSLLAKLVLSLICASFFLGYLFIFYTDQWFTVGVLYIVFAIVSSFTVYLQALLKAQNRFHKYTESTVIYAIAITLAIMGYAYFEFNLLQLVGCLLLAKVLQLLWTMVLTRSSFRHTGTKSDAVFDLIKKSWSFGLHMILGIFYFMVDTQIISIYLGATDVALYQSVFRIVLILLLFSDIISNVLLPYLSFKYYEQQDISNMVSKIFLYMLLIGCSIFLGFTSFKNELLDILYTPEYAKAAILVFPFSIVIVLRTISVLLGNILTISNKQGYRVVTVATSLAVSLILNFICIPKYGILSAAWVSVIVHLVLFGMYFYYSAKEVSNMKVLSIFNLSIVGVTFLIYLVLNIFFPENYWATISCILIWVVFVYAIMKQGDNFTFLSQILKEKGVG